MSPNTHFNLSVALSGAVLALLVSTQLLELGSWFVLLVLFTNFSALLGFGWEGEDESVIDRIMVANSFLLGPIFFVVASLLGYVVPITDVEED